MKLDRAFYEGENVVELAQGLLGKKLCSNINGQLTSGIITETEAYSGRNDKACHANNGLRTKRTQTMYEKGGMAYVYLIYGIYHLFNVVTNEEGQADAVLIRAIQPIDGIDIMLERRKKSQIHKTLTSGPGVLGQAMGFNTKSHTGLDLHGDVIWIEDTGHAYADNEIIKTTRIGVAYAEEDALKPWRFYLKNSEWVSRK